MSREMKTLPDFRTGYGLTESTANPYNSGEVGFWNDNGVGKFYDGSTNTVVGGAATVGGAIRVHAVATDTLANITGGGITYAYANGTAGVGATLTASGNGAFPTVDGVAAALNNIYLVTAQAAGAQNGAYKLTTLGAGGAAAVLTRIEEFDASAEMRDGTLFEVRAGTVNANTFWKYTTADSPTVGTTSLTFERNPLQVTTNTAQTITGVKDFAAGTLKADNNSTTNAHTFVSAATAARNVTLPDATFTVPQDSLVAHLAGAETFTGIKDFAATTLKVDNNNTTNAHTLASAATAARTATFPDATGTVVLQDGAAANGATVANVATGNVIGGIPVEHMFTIADAAGNTDITLTHKTFITDAIVIKRAGAGGAGDTVQVFNGASAITNAISLNVADKATARAGEIDDAANDIAAAGTLRVTIVDGNAGATDLSCYVFVKGFRVA